MAKTTHTHRGTCQSCGSHHAVDNVSGLLAKHGYKVRYGSFQFVCNAADEKPAEHDVTLTKATITACTEAAESCDAEIVALNSGTLVPPTFKRWNSSKIKINKSRHGNTYSAYNTVGDYDTLPIEQATADERSHRIKIAIRDAEMNAAGFRDHARNLTQHVLPRLGNPLFVNKGLAKTALTAGLMFNYEGHMYALQRPATSAFGNRRIGWWVLRVGATSDKAQRWTTKDIHNAMNPKPVKVKGAYATKKARQDDLDALNRKFDAAREIINKTYLAMPREQRTEAKNAIYWGPSQLSHWRTKHSDAVRDEFPELNPTVNEIEALVAERLRVKAAP